jgi:hypothetical protein
LVAEVVSVDGVLHWRMRGRFRPPAGSGLNGTRPSNLPDVPLVDLSDDEQGHTVFCPRRHGILFVLAPEIRAALKSHSRVLLAEDVVERDAKRDHP